MLKTVIGTILLALFVAIAIVFVAPAAVFVALDKRRLAAWRKWRGFEPSERLARLRALPEPIKSRRDQPAVKLYVIRRRGRKEA